MYFNIYVYCIRLYLNYSMSQPILIGELLAYFNPNHSKDTDIKYAYLCSSGLVFSILMTIILFYYTYEEIMNETMKARVACCSLIYRKVNLLQNIL